MQRKLIALAIAGLAAAPAFAQTNVQIYGTVEAIYVHRTNDNTGAFQVGDKAGSALGFQGEEDLGGGLKAFFKFEERFNPDTGTAVGVRFNEISFVGLKGGFGEAIFGRVPTTLDTLFPGVGGQDTEGDGLNRRAFADGRAENGVRYTSPNLGPVNLIAHYGLNERASGSAVTPNSYGIGATAKFNALQVDAGYQRDSDFFKRWLAYAGYDFGVAKVGGGVAHAKGFKIDSVGLDSNTTRTTYYLGAELPLQSSLLGFVVNRVNGKNAGTKLDSATKYGVTYSYSMSKRTKLMAGLGYTRQKNGFSDGADNQVGVDFGLRHNF